LSGNSNQASSAFKTGSQLPTINDRNKKSESKMDFSYKDDFEDDFEEEEEDEDDDFDANELLNLSDYQNKRK
jgi:hypothetical protein